MSNGPAWLAGTFAVVMLGTALYSVGRLITARRTGVATERDVDLVHVGMGTAMAGMLVPSLNPLAGYAWNLGWTLFFGLAVCWFGARLFVALVEGGKAGPAPAHLISSGVMLYMMWPGSTMSMPGSTQGMSMAADNSAVQPVLTLILLGLMGGFAVLAADRVLHPLSAASGGCVRLAPRMAGCCHIAMSVTMGYMLLLML